MARRPSILDLPQFWWERDEAGYRIEDYEHEDGRIEPFIYRNQGPLSAYRLDLFGEHAGLFREFAELDRRSRKEIVGFADRYGFLWQRGDLESLGTWETAIHALAGVVGACEQGRRDDVWTMINSGQIEPQFGVRIEPDARAREARLKVVPSSLLAALWIQAISYSVGATEFRQCESCMTWFPIGPGTGATKRKRFCSDRCRVAWHRHQELGGSK